MTILHGKEETEDFQRKFTEAFEQEQSELTPERFISELRLSTYQRKFCELFATTAPKAWEKLQELSQIHILSIQGEIARLTGQGDPSVVANIPNINRILLNAVESWANEHGVGAAWVQFVSILTVHGIAYSEIGQLKDRPKSLLFNEFPTITFDGDQVNIGLIKGEMTQWSRVIVNPDRGPFEWDTLNESKAQFRNRVLEAYRSELDNQLSRLHPGVPSNDDLEAHAHHIQFLIQHHVNKESIRSISKKWGVSRTAVQKGIRSACERLEISSVPEDWGATPPK